MPAGFNITGQEPIDSRLVVGYVSDLTTASTWTGVGLYNGMVVSIQETGDLYILTNRTAPTNAASWKKAGDGKGSITAANYTAATSLATGDNIGQPIYVLASEGAEENVKPAGLYVVIGAGQLQRLATTTATGDYAEDIAAINSAIGSESDDTTILGRIKAAENDIDTLEVTVGDSTTGLVYDVNALEDAVGDASSGLVHDVAAINTAIGTDSTYGTILGRIKSSEDDIDNLESWTTNNAITDPTPGDGQIKLGSSDVNVYTHPTVDSALAAAKKIGRDATGHVVIGDALTAGDIAYDSTTVEAQLQANGTAISGLQGVVGADANSGLRKSVADNATAIQGLQATVGDASAGLVKSVADLTTTVGSHTTSIGTLTDTVGNSTSGLVHDVATNAGNIQTNTDAITALNATTGATSVTAKIATAIDALGGSDTQTAAEANGWLALSATTENGEITDISGSVDLSKFDLAGTAAAVLGTNADAATANTVYGAKAAAAAAQAKADAAIADPLAGMTAEQKNHSAGRYLVYDGTYQKWDVAPALSTGVMSVAATASDATINVAGTATNPTLSVNVDTTASAGVTLGKSASGVNVTVTTLDTDAVITDSATSVVSGKGVRAAIEAAISGLTATDSAETGKVVKYVTETDGEVSTGKDYLNENEIKLIAVPSTDSAYDNTNYASQYRLVNGNSVALGVDINIPKDQFLNVAHFFASASDVTDYNTTNSTSISSTGVTFPALYFEWKLADNSINPSWVSVSSLVDTYVGSDSIEINNSTNAISLKINEANGLSVDSTNGLTLATVVASDTANSVAGSAGAMTAAQAEKLASIEASAEVNVIEGIKYGSDGTAISLDSNRVADIKPSIDAAIGELDVDNISGFGAGKTLLTLTETDGKIAATFQDIAIEQSAVNGLPGALNNKVETSVAEAATSSDQLVKASTVDTKISDAFSSADLTATQTQTAAAANGQLALSVTTAGGKVTAVSGSIAANTYDAYGAASAVLGESTDATTANTVYGAKAQAEAAQTTANSKITAPTTGLASGKILSYDGSAWVAADAPATGVLTVDKATSETVINVNNTDSANPRLSFKITQTQGNVTLTAESDGLKANVPANTFDEYGAATTMQTTLIGTSGDAATADTIWGAKQKAIDLDTAMDTRVDVLEAAPAFAITAEQITNWNTAFTKSGANETAIGVLNGDNTTTGSVANSIKLAVENLDATVNNNTNVTAGTENVKVSVTETDGVITAVTAVLEWDD